jgi:hypothetical protein
VYFEGNFNRISTLDVSRFKERVLALTESQWNENQDRQQYNPRHQATSNVLFIYDADLENVHRDPKVHPRHAEFKDLLEPLFETVCAHYRGPGYILRAIMPRLPAGASIAPHTDVSGSLINAHRIHLPIVTNPGVSFSVGGETRMLEQGVMVEINNQRTHATRNDGSAWRAHLIIDWVDLDANGELRMKDRLDVLLGPEPMDSLCKHLASGLHTLALEPAELRSLEQSLGALAQEWRELFAAFGDGVSGREAYVAALGRVDYSVFNFDKPNAFPRESEHAEDVRRLVTMHNILRKGFYARA